MADLKILVLKRGTIKGQLTSFETYLEKFDSNNLTKSDITKIGYRLEKVKSLMEKFDTLQDEIDLIETDMETNLDERELFYSQYYNVIEQAESMINILDIGNDDTFSQITEVPNLSENIQVSRLPTNNVVAVNLPKINLPIFDGTYTCWQEFIDSYTAMIHNNQSLTNVQKLCYLKASLKDEPADLLKSLKTTDANYDIAFESLYKRYNKKRRIIDTHVKDILNLEFIDTTSKNAHLKLRKLINEVTNNLRCLESLGQSTDNVDMFLLPIILSKLDTKTNHEWEQKLNTEDTDEVPKYTEFLKFLTNKQNTLEATNTLLSHEKDAYPQKRNQTRKVDTNTRTLITTITKCMLCKKDHYLQNCEEFIKLDVNARNEKVKELKLCLNCLRKGHFLANCRSSTCRKCNKKHNTMLHVETKQSQKAPEASSDNASATALVTNAPREVILSTAEIKVCDSNGKPHYLRALLDSASQSNYITTRACDLLGLPTKPVKVTISGINLGTANINKQTKINIQSRTSAFAAEINCYVLDNITGNVPSNKIKIENLPIPANIKLADQRFHESREVDVLIGAELFWDLFCIGQIKDTSGISFQKTKLGWVVSGPFQISNNTRTCLLSNNVLHEEMKRFWNIDEMVIKKPLSTEEKMCEKIYTETTKRSEDGKFIVKLPLKRKINELGDSQEEAKNRFLSLEKRFERNKDFKIKYKEVIQDYIVQNHMSEVETSSEGFFLPHHGVVKESSETTKLRIVFDASCRAEDGLSLNDIQCTGPTIQEDIFAILTRFRTHQYVVTADITQMYRQVWLHPEQRNLQRIYWREDPSEPLKIFELNTVTFGLTAAPFLAIRSLFEIAIINEQTFPQEAQIIKRDFYVDDLLTGSNSIQEIETIKTNISTILAQAHFKLRKWRDNYSNMQENEEATPIATSTKVLGMCWHNIQDEFSFKVGEIKEIAVTKRNILSLTAQLYDPLGLIAPVILSAKLIIQDIWQLKIGWDESVPLSIYTAWTKFKNELRLLNELIIPRFILVPQAIEITLHGFSDASERAYGACVYVQSTNKNGECLMRLIAAKGRVAPLRKVTLPRLELMGATLLAQLVNELKETLNLTFSYTYLWTDSQIVLAWIKAPANRWKTFVGNRVAIIQELTDTNEWNHITSKENPADVLSRGSLPSQLINLDIWWHGPTNLLNKETNNSSNQIEEIPEIPEERKEKTLITMRKTHFPFENYSNLTKLVKLVEWIMRFKHNITRGSQRIYGSLTPKEKETALQKILKLEQEREFPEEYNKLKKNEEINRQSKILSLNPFMDGEGLMRVGGRLANSQLSYNERHPIILPKNNHITKLIFREKHQQLLHPGPTLLLSTIRQRYWPINGRNIAKEISRKCTVCFRFNSSSNNPIMGNLPPERTKIMPPFFTVGIDYGGPITIKQKPGRCKNFSKAYVCLFICFVTKAIHLEVVSSLTTNAFLAAFRRFISRRGKPKIVYSNNDTNFKGANNELKQIYEFLNQNQEWFADNPENVEWKFIPANSPHFGGLWEAGIKSVKSHLKRIMLNAALTFKELSTALAQIECILNSRPLTVLSSTPDDLQPLTPAHFLVGRPYTLLPDIDVTDTPVARLDRLQYLQSLVQHFWKRWSGEYIASLQQRSKWRTPRPNLQIGTVVLIKDTNLPPSKWHLGKIIESYPGKDGVVRVVKVKTQSGEFKRPVVKLAVLPIE